MTAGGTGSLLAHRTSWIASQRWSFGDHSHDNRSDQANPTHVFPEAGTYRVRLEVSSGGGVRAVSVLMLEVGEAGFIAKSPPVTVGV